MNSVIDFGLAEEVQSLIEQGATEVGEIKGKLSRSVPGIEEYIESRVVSWVKNAWNGRAPFRRTRRPLTKEELEKFRYKGNLTAENFIPGDEVVILDRGMARDLQSWKARVENISADTVLIATPGGVEKEVNPRILKLLKKV